MTLVQIQYLTSLTCSNCPRHGYMIQNPPWRGWQKERVMGEDMIKEYYMYKWKQNIKIVFKKRGGEIRKSNRGGNFDPKILYAHMKITMKPFCIINMNSWKNTSLPTCSTDTGQELFLINQRKYKSSEVPQPYTLLHAMVSKEGPEQGLSGFGQSFPTSGCYIPSTFYSCSWEL
jgi:hypothetical protein